MAYFPGVGAFEQLFGLGRGNLNTNFPKIQMPGSCPGRMGQSKNGNIRWDSSISIAFEYFMNHSPTRMLVVTKTIFMCNK